MKIRITLILLLAGLLNACSQAAPVTTVTANLHPPTPTVYISTPTASHAGIRSTPTLIPTQPPFSPFPISPAVDDSRLRAGPGTLFEALLLLNTSDTLTVQGQAPGGDWILVSTAEGTRRWIFAPLLAQGTSLGGAPVVEPENAQEVRGRLTDFSGLPISGVQFALTRGTDERTDATTDANGEFHAFLPADITGDWLVMYVSIGCTSNAFANDGCIDYKSGYTGVVQPGSLSVTLPTTDILFFQWQ